MLGLIFPEQIRGIKRYHCNEAIIKFAYRYKLAGHYYNTGQWTLQNNDAHKIVELNLSLPIICLIAISQHLFYDYYIGNKS